LSERRPLNWPEELARSRDPNAVREMFNRVAARYDLANHVLSGGCDFLWRKRATEVVASWNPPCILDVATGSGDLALSLKRKLPASKVIGLDFSADMLAIARRKGLRDTITADALKLPLADQSFDAVSIAFGLRNMRDWAAALREMRRVLTPSGHLLVLDFSLPQNSLVRTIYRSYLHCIMPRLCGLLTRDKKAYEYLGTSIENFPSDRAMCDLIEAGGFANATATPLTAGIVTLYVAEARML
jgi:demethylmenaquinone methyltransferase/2-methoxy-6-polyprenyl-1,4-benzoquinol methylase